MSINHLLDIGRSALLTAQYGLDVTANNIANVNTPNYSRQRAVHTPRESVSLGGNLYGSGVEIQGVERVYDAFLGGQITKAYADLNDYQTREQAYMRVESILYPSEDSNLGGMIDDFFNAWQDLANNPAGSAERQMVLAKSEALAENFRDLHGSLEDEIQSTNTLLEGYAGEVNRLASEIAQMNEKIGRVGDADSPPNDLLDRRDALIQELSGYLDPSVIQDDRGMVTVLVSGGQPLIEGNTSYTLDLRADPDNHGFYRVSVRGTDISDSLQGGKIKGLMEAREGMAAFQDDVNRLAAEFVLQLNQLHAAGYDQAGNPGGEFFAPLDVNASSFSTNQGGAAAQSEEITDPSLVTLDDYEIRFTDSNTFDVVNTTRGTVVLSGRGYASGAAIDFDGLRVVLADQGGTPAAGDRFRVSVTQDAAREMRVHIQDPGRVAAAQDPDALPGDNRNALAIADLRHATVVDGGKTTFPGFYQSLIGRVGSEVQNASRKADAGEAVYESMEAYRDSVSGVSLEEEQINLLAFQHAYQSAAKFMSVVEGLMDSLLKL